MRFRVNDRAALDGAVTDVDTGDALGLTVGWVAIQDGPNGRVVAYAPPELAPGLVELLNGGEADET